MVLKRSVPLLQQEEEEFGPDEGIHGAQWKENTERKKRKQKTEGTHRGNSFRSVLLSRFTRKHGDEELTKRESLISNRVT